MQTDKADRLGFFSGYMTDFLKDEVVDRSFLDSVPDGECEIFMGLFYDKEFVAFGHWFGTGAMFRTQIEPWSATAISPLQAPRTTEDVLVGCYAHRELLGFSIIRAIDAAMLAARL